MKVHCITTGGVRPKRRERGVRRYLPGGWSEQIVPVHAFAIEHPDGLCVFDTGQTAAATRRGHLPRWHPFMWLSRFELGPDDELALQMRRRGLAPDEVRWVVLSHLHTDHVGAVADFASAEVIVTREEWQRARGLGGRLRGYVPRRWPVAVEPALIDFTDRRIGPFSSSLDLAGDGRLVLVPAPGHTPGHMAMLVREGEQGYLLCGDLVHEPGDLPSVAPEVDRYCHQERIVVLATHDPGAPARLEAGGISA